MDRIILPKVRIVRKSENHFLKKLSSKITNKVLDGAEKRATKEVASKVGEEKAKQMLSTLKDTKTYDEVKRKTINAGAATLGIAALAGVGALAAPAIAGAGAASAGAGGVSAGTLATGTGAVGAVGAAIPKNTPTEAEQYGSNGAEVFDENANKNVPPRNDSWKDFKEEIKKQVTPETARQVGAKIATGLKNRKERLGTTRRLDDMVTGNETGSNPAKEKSNELLAMFGDTNPMIVIGLVILILLMLMKKRK